MKTLLVVLFFLKSVVLLSQDNERFREGYIIDKFGQKYAGLIRLTPGDGKKSAKITFKESRKSKPESYGPDYVKAFVMASDSFTVVNNIPIENKKTIAADFALVALKGSGGTLYRVETEVLKSNGHASSSYKLPQEKLKYFMNINGKVVALTARNMKDFATIIGDHPDLKSRVLKNKIKFEDLESAIEEYKQSKKPQQ
jgi:hypothetical protein